MKKRLILTIFLALGPVPARAGETPAFKNALTSAAGFPHFFGGQYSRQLNPKTAIGLAIGTSFVPQTTKPTGEKVSMNGGNIEAVSRYFFSGGRFFGGLNAGYQDFSARSTQDTVPGAGYNVTEGARVFYITPHLGWLKVYPSGLTVGSELGIRVPLSVKRYIERSGPGDYDPDARKYADHGIKYLATNLLPFATLIRFGYSF